MNKTFIVTTSAACVGCKVSSSGAKDFTSLRLLNSVTKNLIMYLMALVFNCRASSSFGKNSEIVRESVELLWLSITPFERPVWEVLDAHS